MAEYRIEGHLFATTSLPSCVSYTLRLCTEENTYLFDVCTVNTVLRNIYVDNCLKSVETVKKAEDCMSDVRLQVK